MFPNFFLGLTTLTVHRFPRELCNLLVLQQLVFLAQLAQLGAYGALSGAQRANLAAEVLLNLPAGLQVSLQLFNVLLQSVPGGGVKTEDMLICRKHFFFFFGKHLSSRGVDVLEQEIRETEIPSLQHYS